MTACLPEQLPLSSAWRTQEDARHLTLPWLALSGISPYPRRRRPSTAMCVRVAPTPHCLSCPARRAFWLPTAGAHAALLL